MEEHVISDELFEKAKAELSQGRNWVAYSDPAYFLDVDNMHFFDKKWDAIEFAFENNTDHDYYKVIHAASIDDLLRQLPYGNNLAEPIQHYSIQNSSNMDHKNLDYLKDNLKYLGFGDKLNDKLEQSLREGKPQFQLNAQMEYNGKPVEATLNFRQSEQTGMYFFNNYKATLERNDKETTSQTFYLNKGKGVTTKEAFNLLDGRAVHKDMVTKEGQAYKGWLQLDFGEQNKDGNYKVKQYHEVYGYDLKAAVGKLAIAELGDPKKEEELLKSLQKGNLQAVTIEKDGMSSKMFIEADPQYKKVTLYDANLKMVPKEDMHRYVINNQQVNKEAKEDLSTDKKKDLNPSTKQGKEGLGKKSNKGLLPKKRESSKKGLGIA